MKLIFVTWWVISWLGKGITAASIGRLIKSAWYSITMAKMDPYINIDAGTMSPYEHGETYVTKDWFETDLDLWHYERYINEELTKESSITTAQLYLSVIQKERRGEYLWKNVQVIPHITNEIKERIYKLAEKTDITIIEIGWTVWDIEWPHYIEAMRQLRQELGKENVLFVHVAPILQVTTSWEMKTKAIQHSIIKLRELGIYANILMCRTTKPLTQEIRWKLALFCDIKPERIIENLDQNIYEVPSSFKKQNLDKIIINRFFPDAKKESNLDKRNSHVHNLLNPEKEITIWIAGKYTYLEDCYISVLESLKHAWAHFKTKINIERIDTENLEKPNREQICKNILQEKNIKWIIIPWAFWSRGVEWMINIAEYTRKNKIPFLWICMGLQVATIAFARNVCWFLDANSTEINDKTSHPVVAIMEDQKNINDKWWTMRLGSYPAIITKNTKIYNLYNQHNQLHNEELSKYWLPETDYWLSLERHRHRFEVNPRYHNSLEENWLILSWKSPDGKLVEYIEIPNHPCYIATQAHPEMKSRLNRPHPLFLGLIEASIS